MSDKIAVEFHDRTAHFKEPFLHIFFKARADKAYPHPITYGYVKDI